MTNTTKRPVLQHRHKRQLEVLFQRFIFSAESKHSSVPDFDIRAIEPRHPFVLFFAIDHHSSTEPYLTLQIYLHPLSPFPVSPCPKAYPKLKPLTHIDLPQNPPNAPIYHLSIPPQYISPQSKNNVSYHGGPTPLLLLLHSVYQPLDPLQDLRIPTPPAQYHPDLLGPLFILVISRHPEVGHLKDHSLRSTLILTLDPNLRFPNRPVWIRVRKSNPLPPRLLLQLQEEVNVTLVEQYIQLSVYYQMLLILLVEIDLVQLIHVLLKGQELPHL